MSFFLTQYAGRGQALMRTDPITGYAVLVLEPEQLTEVAELLTGDYIEHHISGRVDFNGSDVEVGSPCESCHEIVSEVDPCPCSFANCPLYVCTPCAEKIQSKNKLRSA